MDNRIETRRKDLKKSFDDPLRRRENEQVQIRKAARDAHLTKKRMQLNPSAQTGGATSNDVLSNPTMISSGNAPASTEIPQEVRQNLLGNDPQKQFEGAKEIRHMLSVETNPPIQCVIEAGLIPRFVEFLADDQRPELQFESAWALTNVASGTAAQTAAVVDAGAIPHFVRLMDSKNVQVKEQAIWALGNIAGDCVELRDKCLAAGSFMPLIRELKNVESPKTRIFLLRYATWTLSNFCRGGNGNLDMVREALPVLRQLLHANDADMLTDACWAISYMSDTSEQLNPPILEEIIKSGVCGRLVELLGHRSYLVQTPALRAVGNIVTGNEYQTQALITYGCIPKLRDLLESPKKAIRKEACWALSNIAAGSREHIQEIIDANVLPHIAVALDRGEYDVKREAAWCIANAASGGNAAQVAAIINSQCIVPLVSVLDVNDPKVVGVALEAIENILKCGKARQEAENLPENPYVQILEEAEAFPKLEKLQFVGNKSRLQIQAIRIMTTYLDAFVENEDLASGSGMAIQ